MLTTALHNTDAKNPKSVLPDNNAITEWIETVSITGFKVCMKDIQPFGDHHDAVNIEYLAIGGTIYFLTNIEISWSFVSRIGFSCTNWACCTQCPGCGQYTVQQRQYKLRNCWSRFNWILLFVALVATCLVITFLMAYRVTLCNIPCHLWHNASEESTARGNLLLKHFLPFVPRYLEYFYKNVCSMLKLSR
jgi:hypothetical protein